MKSNKWLFIALLCAINIVGSKIALLLGLPIFLDSIGTIFASSFMGPLAGMLTALVAGLINGVLGDIYAIYFAPSGILMGLLAGLMLYKKKVTFVGSLWRTAVITVPASALSALIETVLFAGITSSAFTTVLVQTLSKTALSLFTGAFLIQALTDYVDKWIAVTLMRGIKPRVSGLINSK